MKGLEITFSHFYEYFLSIFHILLRFSVSDRLRSTPSGQALRPFYFLCESHMTLPGTSQGVYGLFYFQRGKVEPGKQCVHIYILCFAGSSLHLLKLERPIVFCDLFRQDLTHRILTVLITLN